MGEYIKDVLKRDKAISYVAKALNFPWSTFAKVKLPLDDSTGKLLAEDVFAEEDFPLWHRSTRDGFALKAKDTFSVSSFSPAYLKLKGEIPMGVIPEFDIKSGECARIYTGGFLPKGSDAVLMDEDALLIEDVVEVRKSLSLWENVIRCGEDIRAKDLLAKKGDRINASLVGVLALCGRTKVNCFDIKATVISTGDEVVPISEKKLPLGKIRDINSWTISFTLKELGINIVKRLLVMDDRNRLKDAVLKAIEISDIVMISGGSSVGVRDFVVDVINSLGKPGVLLHGIAIKPGKPTIVGAIDKKLIMGLPGNPLSCFVVLRTFFVPLFYKMIGSSLCLNFTKAVLSSPLISFAPVEEFIPGVLCGNTVEPKPVKSGFVGVFGVMNSLIRVPVGVERLDKGKEAELLLWY